MKITRLALAALALALGSSALLMAQYGPPQDRPQQGYGQDRGGWDTPPQEFREIQRQGFHDGLEAARNDFENHHHQGVEQRREFRHPPVPPPARDQYREGFRRGYESAFSHFREGMGRSSMPMAQNGPPQDRGGWDVPPQEFREVQRQGFHDGLEAARNDFENHHHQGVEQRREFRHPPVPPPARDEYRDGFRRGYESAFSHFRDDHDHH
jgi:Spy/CpxP family protein refolding chaperone